MARGIATIVLALVVSVTVAALADSPDSTSTKSGPPADRIAKLVSQLGSATFADRETAHKTLHNIGPPALAAVQQAAGTATDAEVRRRAKLLAKAIDQSARGELRSFEGHAQEVWKVAFSADGRRMLSGSCSGGREALLWDMETGGQIRRFVGEINCLALAPDGNEFASAGGRGIQVWNAETGAASGGSNRGRGGGRGRDVINCMAYSNDGSRVLTGNEDGQLQLWDVKYASQGRYFASHFGSTTNKVNGVALSPDARLALSGSSDNTLRLWDLATNQEKQSWKVPTGPFFSVSFSADGKQILASSIYDTYLWDLKTGKELQCFKGHSDTVGAAAISLDGKRVLTGSHDATLRLWDVASGKELRCFRGHEGVVWSVAISPDGRHGLSGGQDKTVRLWDLTK